MKPCASCGLSLKRKQRLFCSNKCQIDHQYKKYIQKWKSGSEDGGRGVLTRNISRHVKKYLMEKYKNKCSLCGWGKRNKFTNSIPLEIDHIDGNPENNAEKNLRMVCPNCHSLTTSYKKANQGMGRAWRRSRYKKVRSE